MALADIKTDRTVLSISFWIKAAFTSEEFGARHLADLHTPGSEIITALTATSAPKRSERN
jgi:hypothetical protein